MYVPPPPRFWRDPFPCLYGHDFFGADSESYALVKVKQTSLSKKKTSFNSNTIFIVNGN